MKRSTLAFRSFLHYGKRYLVLAFGTLLSTAVVTGTLITGNSVRESITAFNRDRIGAVTHLLETSDRLFADDLDVRSGGGASVLRLRGSSVSAAGLEVPAVEIYGVTESFFSLFPGCETGSDPVSGDRAAVSRSFAERLSLSEGDRFTVRFRLPDRTRRLFPTSFSGSASASIDLTVGEILPDSGPGRFDAGVNQNLPRLVYVNRRLLAEAAGVPGRANLFAFRSGEPGARGSGPEGSSGSAGKDTGGDTRDPGFPPEGIPGKTVASAIKPMPAVGAPAPALNPVSPETVFSNLTLEDAGYSLGRTSGGAAENGWVLTAPGGFLEPSILDAAAGFDPAGHEVYASFISSVGSVPSGSGVPSVAPARTTSYGFFVSDPRIGSLAPGPWLASNLQVDVGGVLSIGCFTWDEVTGKIGEEKVVAEVTDFSTQEEVSAYAGYVPDFPGLSDKASCTDWSSTVPIDFSRITPGEEEYWARYGKTPRFLVSTALGKKLSPYASAYAFSGALSEREIRIGLTAGTRLPGFTVLPVGDIQVEAGARSTDFTSLLLGMSFFLIASAVILVYFSARVFYRSREPGLSVLRSIGFSPASLGRLLVLEALPALFIGAAAGAAAGAFMPHLVLAALRSIWIGATRTSALSVYGTPFAFPVGLIAGSLPAFAAIVAGAGKTVGRRTGGTAGRKKSAVGSDALAATLLPGGNNPRPGRKPFLRSVAGFLVPAGAVVLICTALVFPMSGVFSVTLSAYAAGAGILVLLSYGFRLALVRAASGPADTPHGLTLVRTGRERGRRMLPFLTVSISLFILLSVAVNRRALLFDPEDRDSPTGGFRFLIETSAPVPPERLGDFTGIASFRRSGTDEANCLNLNYIRTPALLGADTAFLSARNAFSISDGAGRKIGWTALEGRTAVGNIPAFADAAVLTWGLGKKIGDTLSYTVPGGRTVVVEIAGTLNDTPLQGNLVISAGNLVEKFSGGTGPVVFLSDDDGANGLALQRKFSDFGPDVRPVAEILSDFLELENTYLEIFAALGATAFIVGWCALAISIRGDLLDEASSIALMRRIGFSRKRIAGERRERYLLIFTCAWISGVAGAAVSALPVLRDGSGALAALLGTAVPLLVTGAAFIWFASGKIE